MGFDTVDLIRNNGRLFRPGVRPQHRLETDFPVSKADPYRLDYRTGKETTKVGKGRAYYLAAIDQGEKDTT